MDYGTLSYIESRYHPALAYFLGLDVGNRWHHSSRPNFSGFQDFLCAHQTNGAARRIS